MSIRPRWEREENGRLVGAYQVSWFDQLNKRRTKDFGYRNGRSKSEARKAAEEFSLARGYSRYDASPGGIKSGKTVKQAVEAWLIKCEQKGLEQGSIRTYRTVAEHHILPVLGRLKLRQLTRPFIEQYLDKLSTGEIIGGKRSLVMVSKAHDCIRMAYAEAHRLGWVADNAALFIHEGAGLRLNREKRSYPNCDQMEQLLVTSDIRSRAIIALTAHSGLWSGEVRALRWDDVDLSAELVRVRHAADRWGKRKKSRAPRDVRMSSVAIESLRAWRQQSMDEGELVFPTPSGAVMDHAMVYRRVFGDAQKKAGLVDDDGKPKYSPDGVRAFHVFWKSNHAKFEVTDAMIKAGIRAAWTCSGIKANESAMRAILEAAAFA